MAYSLCADNTSGQYHCIMFYLFIFDLFIFVCQTLEIVALEVNMLLYYVVVLCCCVMLLYYVVVLCCVDGVTLYIHNYKHIIRFIE